MSEPLFNSHGARNHVIGDDHRTCRVCGVALCLKLHPDRGQTCVLALDHIGPHCNPYSNTFWPDEVARPSVDIDNAVREFLKTGPHPYLRAPINSDEWATRENQDNG